MSGVRFPWPIEFNFIIMIIAIALGCGILAFISVDVIQNLPRIRLWFGWILRARFKIFLVESYHEAGEISCFFLNYSFRGVRAAVMRFQPSIDTVENTFVWRGRRSQYDTNWKYKVWVGPRSLPIISSFAFTKTSLKPRSRWNFPP